jgi:hypothetical protein
VALVEERGRTWLRIAHFRPGGASYLKLLPYPGLLARPRRGFPAALGVEVFRVFPQFDSVACYAQTSISAALHMFRVVGAAPFRAAKASASVTRKDHLDLAAELSRT